MRGLIPPLDPSWWMTVSALVFLVVFIGLILWVYQPARRRYYENSSRIPLEDDKDE